MKKVEQSSFLPPFLILNKKVFSNKISPPLLPTSNYASGPMATCFLDEEGNSPLTGNRALSTQFLPGGGALQHDPNKTPAAPNLEKAVVSFLNSWPEYTPHVEHVSKK